MLLDYFNNDKIYKIKNLIKLPLRDIDKSRTNKYTKTIILHSILFNNLFLLKLIIKKYLKSQ